MQVQSVNSEISVAAAACYLLWSFGATWLLCERGSDWGTERWGNGTRAMLLLGGAFAWIVLFAFFGNHFAKVDRLPDEGPYMLAAVTGVPTGILGYWIYRRFLFPRARQPNDGEPSVERSPSGRRPSLLDKLLIERFSSRAPRNKKK
jgi:hypothetical protein